MLYVILLVCFFTLGTLFFSTNAVALRIFSRARLQESFKKAGRKDYSESLGANSEKLILTCAFYRLLFNLCILLLLLFIFTAGMEKNNIGSYLTAFAVAGVIFVIFSLAIPNAWAKYSSEKIIFHSYRTLFLFTALLKPASFFWRFIDGFVKRLAGVAETTPDRLQEEKEEEFLTDLEQQRIEGVVDREEMIESVLELDETTADEIMTPRTDIVAIQADSDLPVVLNAVSTAGHSRVPVYEKNIDNIIGFIYAKDLLSEIGKDPGEFRLREKLRQAYFVPESKSLRDLLHEFQNQKLHIAVVLDEYGGTAGIVSLEDILEELVGEITDEYEKTPPEPIKHIDEYTIEIDARTNIDDVNDEFGLDLPEDEDYDTAGGFVFSYLGYIPKTGESFDYENTVFTISAAERRRIKRIKIQKKPKEE
jgi:CBS domain containing-hemolysin-like protein